MTLGIFGLWIRVVLGVRISLDAYFDFLCFQLFVIFIILLTRGLCQGPSLGEAQER